MSLAPGVRIAGRYRVETLLGKGASGEVWVAEHGALGVKVAVKRLLAAATEESEAVARFRREAAFLARIKSDYVARVLDFVLDEEHGLILVMDLIEGQSLDARLRLGRSTVEEAIELGADVAAALCDLHAVKIVHRDLKPANIILRPLADGRERAMIVDFSLSRLAPSLTEEDSSLTDLTRSNMALGTLPYMAPEQLLNARDVTSKSDIYALGAILFRAVMGGHIFSPTEVDLGRMKLLSDPEPMASGRSDSLARSLEAVVDRAIRRKPADRFAGAVDMYRELSALRELSRRLETEEAPTLQEDVGPIVLKALVP
jgi:serine/threonine protein kinase